jgi:protein TonB
MSFRLTFAVITIALTLTSASRAQEPTVYAPGDGVSLPSVTKQVRAQYTQEAMQNRIEGTVGLSVVVLANGTVGEVNVTESLDSIYGLDAEAVKAMRQWEFKPGTKDGKAVAVRVTVKMKFSLQ